MSEATPQFFVWDAERSVMVPRRPSYACRTYVDGEEYRLGIIEERSPQSHSHYFAALHETWSNLPDNLSGRYPTAEHLRKAALIATGWCDSHTLVCASKAEAQRVAAFMRPCDEFAVVVAKEATVTRYVAKSQSARAMGNADFQKSKTDVLDYVAALIKVESSALRQAAGNAA